MTNGSAARIPVPVFLRPPSLSRCLLTETENTIIDGILELLNTHGLTSHQSMNLPPLSRTLP